MTSAWPAVNAGLNFASVIFLTLGYVMIRKNKPQKHRICMLGAFVASIIFLVSYLMYHWKVGSIKFQGTGLARQAYLTVLISHSFLAALVPPLAVRTIYLALHQRFAEHRRAARWTLPIWLYVGATGVLVYFLLYHWPS